MIFSRLLRRAREIALWPFVRFRRLLRSFIHLTSTVFLSFFSIFRIKVAVRGHVPILNRFKIGPSRIPQFLLDTHHPWIERNRTALERIDARNVLLSPDSPLRCWIEPIPDDLFQTFTIKNNQSKRFGDLGWQYAAARLKEISSCQRALSGCQTLKVDIYRHAGGKGKLWEPARPTEELLALFVNVLSDMPNLHTIDWFNSLTQDNIATSFKKGFAHYDLLLPTVKHLSLGVGMEFLVLLCPNLKSLRIVHDKSSESFGREILDTITSAQCATDLVELTLKLSWDADLLELVLGSMPQLQTLNMLGEVNRYGRFSLDMRLYNFQVICQVLGRYPHLSTLRLPPTTRLGLGDDQEFMCGNAFLGLDGTHYRRQLYREHMWAEETAANMVLAKAPSLQWLGFGCGKPDKVTDGQITWPWTGRIREYLLENCPRYRSRKHHVLDEDPEGPIFSSFEEDEIMLKADYEQGDEFIQNRRRRGKLNARDIEIDDEIERELEALAEEMRID